MVKGSILRLGKIGQAVLAEILLISCRVSAILDKIFSIFGQEEVAFRVLAGHWTVTSTTRHDERDTLQDIKVAEYTHKNKKYEMFW